MKLVLNGRPHESSAETLDALFRIEAEEAGLDGPQGIAIALNGAVVRRRDWETTRLGDGDRVEIVRAMQGG